MEMAGRGSGEGGEGLTREKTRTPANKPRRPTTLQGLSTWRSDRPPEKKTLDRSKAAAKEAGVELLIGCKRILEAHQTRAAIASARSSCDGTEVRREAQRLVGIYVDSSQPMRSFSRSTEKSTSRHSTHTAGIADERPGRAGRLRTTTNVGTPRCSKAQPLDGTVIAATCQHHATRVHPLLNTDRGEVPVGK